MTPRDRVESARASVADACDALEGLRRSGDFGYDFLQESTRDMVRLAKVRLGVLLEHTPEPEEDA